LKGIQIPTLIVQPRDDPFMTDAVIPQDEELSSAVKLEFYDHGGHVGFVGGGWPWAPICWLEGRILRHLGATR
jgi:predicted alpha/beta-fold hydrolase